MNTPPPIVWRLAQAAVALIMLGPWFFALFPEQRPILGLFFASMCHQLPERSLHLLGAPMVVCSRCAGLYTGAALGILLPAPEIAMRHLKVLLFAAAVPMALDVLFQTWGLYPPYHPTRFGSGFLLSLVFASCLLSTLRGNHDVHGVHTH